LGDDPELSASFDPTYINRWATDLGPDVEQFWQNLQQLVNLDN
jgi:hypothetical protein